MYQDIKVLISNRNYDGVADKVRAAIFMLPVDEGEVREALGNECIDSGNYSFEFIDAYSSCKFFNLETLEDLNNVYYRIKRLYDTYPDFPDMDSAGKVRSEGDDMVPFDYIIDFFDTLKVVYDDDDEAAPFDEYVDCFVFYGNDRVFIMPC